MSAARRRFTTCKCCGGLSVSAYCDNCSARHVQRLAVAKAAVAALWGADGVTRFKAELRARRLGGRRATTRRTA